MGTWYGRVSKFRHTLWRCSVFVKPSNNNPCALDVKLITVWGERDVTLRCSRDSCTSVLFYTALHWQPAWKGHCTHLWIAVGHAVFPQQNQQALAGLGVNTWGLCLASYSPWPKAEINHVTFCAWFSSGLFSGFSNSLELESWPPLMGTTLFPIPSIFQWQGGNLHQNIQTTVLSCRLLLSSTWCKLTCVFSAMPVYEWSAAHRYLCAVENKEHPRPCS